MTQPRFYTFAKSDIGDTPERLTDNPNYRASQGIQLLASSGNTDVVYIGSSENFTMGTNDDTDGFPLGPGDALLSPTINPYNIYVSSNGSGQRIDVFLV